MVIRLFDDVPTSAAALVDAGNHVLCPACQGLGEIVDSARATQDYFGVWSAPSEPCTACGRTGVVSADDAIEVDCCTDNEGRPLTRWRGDRCRPEHELLCDEHLVCREGCGTFGQLDDDPWADDVRLGRSA